MKKFFAFTVPRIVACLAAVAVPYHVYAGGSVLSTYTLVNSVRSGRTTFDYTYTITVKTDQYLPTTGVASVKSSDVATQVIKGSLTFGCPIAQGEFTALPNQTYVSTDTFTIRQDRTKPFNPKALTWTVGLPADSGRFKKTLPTPPASPCDPKVIASITSQQPVAFPTPGVTVPGAQITISGGPGATIYYALDSGQGAAPTPTTTYTGPLALTASAPRLTTYAVGDEYYPSGILTGNYTLASLPSDGFPGPGIFLADTLQDSCNYYANVAAIIAFFGGGCTTLTAVATDTYTDINGNTVSQTIYGYNYGLTFDDWITQTAFSEDNNGNIVNVGDGKNLCGAGGAGDNETLTNGGIKACATFINMMDLNFTRDHHAVWNGLSGDANKSAAYVCNFKGPDFYHDQFDEYIEQFPADVDQAILNTQTATKASTGRLPCVAFDYGILHDSNSHPIMRFFAFDPGTRMLLQQVDLDGRGPKNIPDACSACHGVPANGTSAAKPYQIANGGSYIPFDENNLKFSSHAGLRQADQESRIKSLNLIALQGQNNSGPEMSDLIHGWYGQTLSSPTQSFYFPAGYLADVNYTLVAGNAYASIYGPMCRSCHVANGVQSGFPVNSIAGLRGAFNLSGACNPNPQSGVVMPNAKVTFDRLWTTHVGAQATGDTNANDPSDLIEVLQAFLNTSCGLPFAVSAH